MARYYQVIAIGMNDEDTRFASFTARREGLGGSGFSFATLVLADDLANAEEKVRRNKRFRRVCRQNKTSVNDVSLLVEEATKTAGLVPLV